jgi:hypothetical protein
MVDEVIEKTFPQLQTQPYQITSPADRNYNCIAWAADDTKKFWWPDPQYLYYWPPTVIRVESLEAFIKAFQLQGYMPCDDGQIEPGYEKVAIYADSSGKPKHMARQLSSGEWTSKLGKYKDIEHSVEGIAGACYGQVIKFLKRPISK